MSEFINTIDLLGDDAVTDSIINRSIAEFKDDKITSIGDHAFTLCQSLENVNCPSVTDIGSAAFSGCGNLIQAVFSNLVTAGNLLMGCEKLISADLGNVEALVNHTFASCGAVKIIILRNTTKVCSIPQDIFILCYHFSGKTGTGNPTGAKDGFFYVPAALVDSYKTATYWSNYASQFRALEDYTVDGTTTGELDPNKI